VTSVSRAAFSELLTQSRCILGEGAVIERLRRDSGTELDPDLVNSAFIYEDRKREALATICGQYLDIGGEYDLPLLLSTPTWRASRERIAAAGYEDRDVNGDNFRFLDALRGRTGAYAKKVAVCGLMSCRGNAYDPTEALSAAAAREFHAWQAGRLAAAGVDFLLAATLPAVSEARGLAAALAATGKEYIVSFVIRAEGTLLDGTPLKEAVAAIDADTRPRPLAYMINCSHVSFFKAALLHERHSSPQMRKRLVGLLANTAPLNPEDLDESAELVGEAPEVFGRTVGALHWQFGMKILGGCCGTDERHIRSLASQLAEGDPE
jgi:homocysteine S-methyltransferase